MPIDQNTTVQVITNTQIIGIGGVSAMVGSVVTLVGIWLKSYFEAKENKKMRIFEARTKAYAGLIGHLNNSFAKYNFSVKDKTLEEKLNELAKYSANMDYELSAALLFSSKAVKEKLEIYKQKIFELKGNIVSDHHQITLDKNFNTRIQETGEIWNIAAEIIKMIRLELGVE